MSVSNLIGKSSLPFSEVQVKITGLCRYENDTSSIATTYQSLCIFSRVAGLLVKILEKRLETELVGFSYGEFDRHGEFLKSEIFYSIFTINKYHCDSCRSIMNT